MPNSRWAPKPSWMLGLLVLFAPSLLPAAAGATPSPSRLLGFEQQILDLSNSARQWAGCPPLRPNAALSRAASEHSAEMAEHNFFQHTDSAGRDPVQRAHDAGYPGDYVGENIAAGNSIASVTFKQWMTSPGHRRNILDCSYTDLGVGHSYSESSHFKDYWSQELGNPELR